MIRGRDLVKRLAGEEVADPVDVPVAGSGMSESRDLGYEFGS